MFLLAYFSNIIFHNHIFHKILKLLSRNMCLAEMLFRVISKHYLIIFQTICLLAAILCICDAAPQTTNRPEVSESSLDMALKDRRYLMRQLKCALGEAACDPVGRRLKSKSYPFCFRENSRRMFI